MKMMRRRMRRFNMPFDGEEGTGARMRGVACTQEAKEALFQETRLELVMRLKGCSLEEAREYIRTKNTSKEG